jgi:acyl dehydratase
MGVVGQHPNPEAARVLTFEDLGVGDSARSVETYQVLRDEVVDFARRWDPQPFHLDERAAEQSIFGGLSACAAHVFAIQCRLAASIEPRWALLAGLGNDGFELTAPVRPGDRLHLLRRVSGKRASRSKPDRGIVNVEHDLVNQQGEVVFRAKGRMMIARQAR